MMPYESSERFRSFRHEKRLPSGNKAPSLSETAMYRVKQLLGGNLSLRNYNAQVGETYAMIKALNKFTRLVMPETQYVVQESSIMEQACLIYKLSNKALIGVKLIKRIT